MTVHFPFDNTYARLPDRFYARLAPTPVPAPRLVRLNRDLAVHLRLDPDWLAGPEGVAMLAGRDVIVEERQRVRVRDRIVLRYYARTIEHLLGRSHRTTH